MTERVESYVATSSVVPVTAPRGVAYVALGEPARREATESIRSLRRLNDALPVFVIAERPLGVEDIAATYTDGWGWRARRPKLRLDRLSPFQQTLYLDADTRVLGSLAPYFDALDDGYDLVLCHSALQELDALANCSDEERRRTYAAAGTYAILALQCGAFSWTRNVWTEGLFAAWRAEHELEGREDQAAFLRALLLRPLRYRLLGQPFNLPQGDARHAVVEHRFGKAVAR